MLFFFSSMPFYTSQIQFPMETTPISPVITKDPHFQFFSNCIGIVDGTHIHAFISVDDHLYMHNQKGFLSKNCLFICNFNFCFIYALTSWDGSIIDTSLWNDAYTHDLEMLQGKYLLADAGFGISDTLLVPYQGVQYHLKEWWQVNLRYWTQIGFY